MGRIASILRWIVSPPELAFGGSATPPATPIPPPPPAMQSPQGAQAADDAAKRAEAAKGFGSTILTGPLGDQSQPNLARKSLLGS